jgi:hypothetical protein
LDDLLAAAGDDDLAVDVLLAKLVFDHGNLVSVSFGKYPAKQRGFTRTQKSREYRGRNKLHISYPRTTMV